MHIISKIGKINLLKLNQGHILKLYKELVRKYKSIPKLTNLF
ncbi:hypothetical protein [Blautia producta]